MAQGNLQPEQIAAIRDVGGKVKDLEVRGEPIPDDLAKQWEPLQPVAPFVQNLFGGRLREATTSAAPIAPEILGFFRGCGTPALGAYGMTETSNAATPSAPAHSQ